MTNKNKPDYSSVPPMACKSDFTTAIVIGEKLKSLKAGYCRPLKSYPYICWFENDVNACNDQIKGVKWVYLDDFLAPFEKIYNEWVKKQGQTNYETVPKQSYDQLKEAFEDLLKSITKEQIFWDGKAIMDFENTWKQKAGLPL